MSLITGSFGGSGTGSGVGESSWKGSTGSAVVESDSLEDMCESEV